MRAAVLTAALGLAAAGVPGLVRAQSVPQAPATVANGFRVQARPTYEGRLRQGQAIPMTVQIENRGEDAAGEILVVDPRGQAILHYPVALPQGAKKDVPVVLPPGGLAEEISLSTNRGVLPVQTLVPTGPARASLLVVGDDSGGYGFLGTLTAPKPKTSSPGSYSEPPSAVVVVAYVRPEAFPDSEAALDRTAVVALASGSERLTAPAIAAIRRYVLRGGHLALIGGASSPILSDTRLADLIPYSALTPGEATVRGQRISVQRPTPIASAQTVDVEGVPVVRRTYGVGRVSFFAADPTDAPFRNVAARARLVATGFDLQRSAILVSGPLTNGPDFAPSGVTFDVKPGEIDPFALPIPPTLTILYVLGAYFLVVLPVNFLILRALRRLELAWYTAPLVSLAFAGVLFRNAGSLYKTGLSHAATTVVFTDSGAREGLALGKGQIFFPSAARGPIPIADAEAIGTDLFRQTDEYYYSSRQENARPLDVTVTDRAAVPNYASAALEFRDVDYHQALDLGNGVRVIETKRRGGTVIEVENGSPFTLTDVAVIPAGTRPGGTSNNAGATSVTALRGYGQISPGARAVVSSSSAIQTSGLSAVLWSTAPLLVATMNEAPVGPRLGSVIGSRSWTRLIVSGEAR